MIYHASDATTFQAALDRVHGGDEIRLPANTTLTGSFLMRKPEGTGYVTIRSERALRATAVLCWTAAALILAGLGYGLAWMLGA